VAVVRLVDVYLFSLLSCRWESTYLPSLFP
jgi:hypothetical protein